MLIQQIESKRRQIQTDSYPMSIGEIVNLYSEGELDIHPEFQRVHRWTDTQKSKLIESILLGIPLPSIFVSQRSDGVWDVIDGVQRLSTIFEFLGIYRDDNNQVRPPLTLEATKLLPALLGRKWDGEGSQEIDILIKRQFKREKVDIKIIKKEGDPVAKYDLFQRLNTLGTKLSDQEVRNCLLLMINKPFFDKMAAMAANPSFTNLCQITERQEKEQYDLELCLRFLIFRWYLDNQTRQIGDASEFFSEIMELIASDSSYDLDANIEQFNTVFQYLDSNLGENVFRKKKSDGAPTGSFSISYFDAIVIKSIKVLNTGGDLNSMVQFVNGLHQLPEFIRNSGAGVRASTRIKKCFEL